MGRLRKRKRGRKKKRRGGGTRYLVPGYQVGFRVALDADHDFVIQVFSVLTKVSLTLLMLEGKLHVRGPKLVCSTCVMPGIAC